MNEFISDAYLTLWSGLEARIAAGIRTHRTAQTEVRVVDRSGAPVAGAVVAAEQTGHVFRFGANCFLYGGYDDAGMNQRYEERFLQLFNAATVAMYWKDLEPEPGHPRFAAGSPRLWRRPPTDPVIAWCRANGLAINGHTLVWDSPQWQIPAWLPADPAERGRLTAERIRALAARYGAVVQRWDVLNERAESFRQAPRYPQVPMQADCELEAFRVAQQALPPEAVLMINDYYQTWDPRSEQYRDLIRDLDARGARIDGIGLQCHCFSAEGMRGIGHVAAWLRGDDLAAALDAYVPLGRPVHVSEITLPQPAAGPAGEEAQARIVRDFYRLWFSHPVVDGITWWNVADGGAAPGEDTVQSGLIDANHQPKAAFHALDRLINHEWRTRTGALVAGAEGAVRFRGFKGAYRLTAEAGGRRASVEAVLAADGVATIVMP